MKKTFAIAAAAAVVALGQLAMAGAAQAQSTPEFAFNAGVTSDYVFRGFSQTNEDPAVFGGVDATVGSFYAGAWASNVDFGDSTDAEVDVYGGYRTEAAGFAFDVGVVGYLYVDAPDGVDYDYLEVKLAASRAIGPYTIGAAAYISPDFFGLDEEAVYGEVNAAYAADNGVSVSGAVGFQSLDVNEDYTTWNVGLGLPLVAGIGLDVRYHDTDYDGTLSEGRGVATLKYAF
ncbi:hypothetical protein JIP62_05130 [Brevundimonas vitis]|uniref:Outer membrane protein beta-barrel domain-containing protein n=1 Tax=Brevundimonas vitisensis TaxID=2800818 RepID=A0ABX7BPU9_9CAUL|nr:TorF family putative porin [Brevundimonas vitisensis]QQQ19480.1 hypothetical protein JIP62_05130 [Brevundimonas vitisensis]